MVAELTDIYTRNVERKALGDTRDRPCRRPKWIETATREPIYSVLDVDDEPASVSRARANHPPLTYPDRNPLVIVISAAKDGYEPKPIPESIEKYDTNTIRFESEEEEEEALYSVVERGRRVRRTVDKTQRDEERLGGWLRLTSRRSVSRASRRYRFDEMYPNENDDTGEVDRKDNTGEENGEEEDDTTDKGFHPNVNDPRLTAVPVPRGIVGLVGPYRVYQNPNEKREYMLREEELVEDVVDSVSDLAVSRKNWSGEPRRRAKWKIREDDEETTLVPDIRRLPSFREYEIDGRTEQVDKVGSDISEWKIVDERCCNNEYETEDSKFEGNGFADKVEGILSGKGEHFDVDAKEISSYDDDGPTKEERASNEQQEKDSLNETASTAGGNVEPVPSGTPGRGERSKENESSGAQLSSSSSPPSRSLVSRILARARSPKDLLDHTEPFTQLWIVLSNVYGELVIVLMMALCLAEVMDTPVPLLSLQGIFLMYLYVGSIAVIIGIYIWVLLDSCASLNGTRSGIDDVEIGGTSITRFGSLKRAHISRARTAPTSFYIRVGALLFGLATLVFNGLEMAMHSMMQGAECLSDVVFAHPVLHGLFTFLQMHFLFVNSQVLVERFGLAARFGFTHLAATNIAVWVRLVIWDSAQEWTYFVYLAQRGSQTSASTLNLRGFPGSLTRHSRDLSDSTSEDGSIFRPYRPISNEQISQVIALQECLNTNTLGQLWTSSLPFLYPFIVQFSLIAAAVTFVMGQNVGRSRVPQKQKFHGSKDLTSHARVGCDGSSKGLFLGILCMVAGIVVILIFLVVREDEHFSSVTLSWLTCGTLIGILALSGLMTSTGLIQIRQMPVVTRAPAALDSLLSNVAIFGVQLYSIFTIVVCACSLALIEAETEELEEEEKKENGDASFSFGASKTGGRVDEGNFIQTRGRHIMLLSASILQLIQCFAQSTLIAETSRRSCITRFQMLAKPGRQVITFLLFTNAVLWAFDTVITQNWISQELQLRFFGVLVWGILSRIGLPLLIFYRFHSCVLLLEAWNKCYRTPRGEHPLN